MSAADLTALITAIATAIGAVTALVVAIRGNGKAKAAAASAAAAHQKLAELHPHYDAQPAPPAAPEAQPKGM